MTFTICNNRVLCYQDTGEPALPALLLAHPLGLSQAVWAGVVARLRGRFRCVSWDLPGHGASAPIDGPVTAQDLAADAIALLDHLGIRQTHFVGTSIGGAVGQAMLTDAPERLKRIVLTNTGAIIGTPDKWHTRAKRVRGDGLSAIAGEIAQGWFGSAFQTAQPAAADGWAIQLARTDDESYARLCELLAAFDCRGALGDADLPVQLVAGSEDGATPLDTLATLANELPRASLETLGGIGHVPSLECPDALAARLPNWLADVRSTGPRSYEDGLAVRKALLGNEHVERAAANATTLDAPFQNMITRMAWGELWGNNDLTRSERSMITLAVLASLGRDDELVLHLNTARRVGLTEAQLRQALMHVAIYAGVPAANHAFKRARENGWGEVREV